MINRKLFKVEVTSSSITKARKEEILSRISKQLNINKKEAEYFLSISSIENNMYKKEDDSIEIIYKDGSTCDISQGFRYAQHLSPLPKSQEILYMLPAFRKRRTLNN